MFIKNKAFTILIIASTVIYVITASSFLAENNSKTFYKAVADGLRMNRQGFQCGVLSWNAQEKIDRSIINRPDTSGQYNMWWNNEKIATRYMRDNISGDEKSGWTVTKGGEIKAFNGKEFRAVDNVTNPKDIGITHKVEFRPLENYFKYIKWKENFDVISYIDYCMKSGQAATEWSAVDVNGQQLIKFHILDKQVLSADYYFDPSKNYEVVQLDQFSKGKQQFTIKTNLQEVIKGHWFPIQVSQTSYSLLDGRPYSERIVSVDMEKSSFNEPSKIPEEIFELKITDGMEISDYRLGFRILYKSEDVYILWAIEFIEYVKHNLICVLLAASLIIAAILIIRFVKRSHKPSGAQTPALQPKEK